MAKSNIVFRSYRLNLDNEQQRRVNKVLAELNTDIHKSVNQFITDAIDFYANSFGDKNLLRETGGTEERGIPCSYNSSYGKDREIFVCEESHYSNEWWCIEIQTSP